MENWLINDKLFEILSYEIRRKYNDVISFAKCQISITYGHLHK